MSPVPQTQDASLGVGHIWTAVTCPAYATLASTDCTCRKVPQTQNR